MPDKPPIIKSSSHEAVSEIEPYAAISNEDKQDSNNAAANGYWIHDDTGPKHYVAPPDASSVDVNDADLITRIERVLENNTQLDASRVHVTLDNGFVKLIGIAGSEQESRLAEQAVKAAIGDIRVTNQLVVEESLK